MSQDELFELGIYAPEVLDERIIVYLKCGGGVLLKHGEYAYIFKLDEFPHPLFWYSKISIVNVNKCKLDKDKIGHYIRYRGEYVADFYIDSAQLKQLQYAFNLKFIIDE